MTTRTSHPTANSVLRLDIDSEDPLEAVAATQRAIAELMKMREEAVANARAHAATWEQLGAALGMARQSAWQNFRHVGDDSG